MHDGDADLASARMRLVASIGVALVAFVSAGAASAQDASGSRSLTYAAEEREDVKGALEFMGGASFFDVSKINERLAAAGYGELPSTALMLGGHSHALAGRFTLGGSGAWFQSPETAGPPGLHARYEGGWGGFEVGYTLVDTAFVGFIPSLTVGGYGFDVAISEVRTVSFDTMLKSPSRDVHMTQQGAFVSLALPIEMRVETTHTRDGHTGLIVGFRPAATLGIPIGDWTTPGGKALDAPKQGLNGGYLAITIGAGGW